jgi:hypothetical protein
MDAATPTWVLFGVLLVSSSATAAPCPPAAIVSGDPELAAGIGQLLAGHQVAAADSEACPAVRADVARRAGTIVIVRLDHGLSKEHVVSEVGTAATVIESWTHSELDDPLLGFHPAEPPPLAVADTQMVSRLPAPPPVRRIQAFGALESSLADDRTNWLGFAVGACVQLGTVCASVRGRFAAVVVGPRGWRTVERHAEDVLFGGDIPLHLRAATLSVGFGAGIGATHTGIEDPAGIRGRESFGLRADAHVAWEIPLAHGLAIDLSASLDVQQVTDVETSSTEMLADEPRILGRIGAGLRLGAQ